MVAIGFAALLIREFVLPVYFPNFFCFVGANCGPDYRLLYFVFDLATLVLVSGGGILFVSASVWKALTATRMKPVASRLA